MNSYLLQTFIRIIRGGGDTVREGLMCILPPGGLKMIKRLLDSPRLAA